MKFPALVCLMLVGCSSASKNPQQIACMASNGHPIYSGMASNVAAHHGVTFFTPLEGPQTGKRLATTFACVFSY